MKLNLPVLLKDDSWFEHREKLREEYNELNEVITDVAYMFRLEREQLDLLHLAEETLDVMEICIGILDKLEQEHKGIIEKANLNHVKKLAERGWQFKAVLEIRED